MILSSPPLSPGVKKEVMSVLFPVYSLLKIIERRSRESIQEQYINKVTGFLLVILFSVLTFVGITKKKMSNTILFSEIVFSGYFRFYEKITRPSSSEERMFIFFTPETLKPIAQFCDKHDIMVFLGLLITSFVMGYISGYILEIARFLISVAITFYAQDNSLFKEMGLFSDESNEIIQIIAYFVLFVIIFVVMGLGLKYALAGVFSAMGSLSLSVVLESFFGLKLGMEEIFNESDTNPIWKVSPDNPGLIFFGTFFFLGLMSQLILLK